MDIYEELKTLTTDLERQGVEYALCGGLAVAVHGHVRATVDIDLLLLPKDLEAAFSIASSLGFKIKGKPMAFADGKIIIRRTTKVFPSGDFLPVDFTVVTEEIRTIWESRRRVELEDVTMTVVSREGLVELKRLRGSKQDLADIEYLERADHDA